MAEQFESVTRVQVLNGHTDQESAYLVPDYPYGRTLRCKIRYWVETATAGPRKGEMRFVSQTTDARNGNVSWNKPKASTYTMLAVMFLDSNEHVKWSGVDINSSPEIHNRWSQMGIVDQLIERDRRLYEFLLAASQKRGSRSWAEYETKVTRLAQHMRDVGEPEIVNGTWTDPETGRPLYLMGAPEVYLTTARERVAQSAL